MADLIKGINPTGHTKAVAVDANGQLKVVATISGGGTSTAANQVLEIADLDKLAAQTLDYDTGAGVAAEIVFGIALPASGGPVAGGTSTNPIRTDPTGTTAQPITDNSGSLTVDAPVGTPAFVRLSDGSAAITTLPVSLASVPSHAVTNAGTFAVQATLQAGSALAGKVGIDQTTPGTTNAVAATNLPTTVDTNSGNKSASTLRVVLATDQPALTNKLLVTPDSVALPANQSVNVSQINGVTPLMGAGNTGTGSPRVTIASDQAVIPAGGSVAHDGVDSGNPIKAGARALSYGTNPTGVSSNDRTDLFANIAGIQFVISGHPNIITRRDNYTSAQTDTKIVTVSGGTKIVVVSCTIVCDAATTTKPLVRAGFAQTNTPTAAGVYISHPGLSAGSGIREAGAVAGADGDDWIFTCAVPTSGSIDVVTKYFTIES